MSMRSTSSDSMVRVNSHGVWFALLCNGSYVPTIFSVNRIPGFSLTKLVLSVNERRCHVFASYSTFSCHLSKRIP